MKNHVLLPTLGILAAAGCGGGLESTNRSDAEALRISTRAALLAQLGVTQEGIQPDGSAVKCSDQFPASHINKQVAKLLALADAGAAACGYLVSITDGRVEGEGRPRILGGFDQQEAAGDRMACVRVKPHGVECNK